MEHARKTLCTFGLAQARRALSVRAIAAPAPPTPNLDERIHELTSALHHVEQATTRDAATLEALQQGLTQLRSDWHLKQQQLTQLCDLVSELRTASTDVIVLTHQVARAQAKVDHMQLLMQARELEIQQLTERLHALQPAAVVGASNVALLERPVVSGRQWLDQPPSASNLAYIDGTWLQEPSNEEDAEFWALEPVPGMTLNVPVAKLAAWAQTLKPTYAVFAQCGCTGYQCAQAAAQGCAPADAGRAWDGHVCHCRHRCQDGATVGFENTYVPTHVPHNVWSQELHHAAGNPAR